MSLADFGCWACMISQPAGQRKQQSNVESGYPGHTLTATPLKAIIKAYVVLSFSFMNQGHNGVWRSLVAHLLWEQGVGGSNPSTPTNAISAGEQFCARSSCG